MFDEFKFHKPESVMQDLRERLFQLKTFDRAEEIHGHCDELVFLVTATVESAVRHLGEIQEELLDEVACYRDALLEQAAARPSQLCDEVSRIEDAIERIQDEISTRGDLEDLICLADELTEAMRAVKRQLRQEAFQSKFMRFKADKLFFILTDQLGSFEVTDDDEKPYKKCGEILAQVPKRTLSLDQTKLNCPIFLSNGQLVTSSSDLKLRQWSSVETGKGRPVYKSTGEMIVALEQLPGRSLICGDKSGRITILDANKSLVARIEAHARAILSIRALPTGGFASMSLDDTIKIWPAKRASTHGPLHTLSGHGCVEAGSRLGVLSNGVLVTVSADEDSVIRLWDPRRGRLVREVETNILRARAFAVLSNDDLAVADQNGAVFIINLADRSLCKKLIEPDASRRSFILELPNGCLLLASEQASNSCLQVWDPRSGRLVQTVVSGHANPVRSCSLSSDKRSIASESQDGTVQIWSLNLLAD